MNTITTPTAAETEYAEQIVQLHRSYPVLVEQIVSNLFGPITALDEQQLRAIIALDHSSHEGGILLDAIRHDEKGRVRELYEDEQAIIEALGN